MRKKPRKDANLPARKLAGYDAVLADLVRLLESARRAAARAVNAVMTAAYWEVGRRIVEFEQGGSGRAEYGRELVTRLGTDLTIRFGRGFGWRNLYQMRAFYLAYPGVIGVSHESAKESATATAPEILQTVSAKSTASPANFPLPWSHYVRLMTVENPDARRFYEAEALRGGWSVRQLNRQIGSQFYERTLLSRNKAAMLTRGAAPRPEDAVTPEEEIKDPFVLEFLGLKDEYSEGDLEEALIRHLEMFLLELGGDFTFVGRQRRLRVGNTWYRIDLLFYHRRLRCLVVIDLKAGEFTHADAGQMHLYLNYAREHWTHPGENPPVGIVLCAEKNNDVVHYALDGLPNQVLAAEYRTTLPDERTLLREVEKTRRRLEARPPHGE